MEVANAATKFKTVEKCLEWAFSRDERKANDGHYMGADCPNTSEKPPSTGTLPEGCAHCASKFPKIIYTNGVDTDPKTACQTMHLIADTRCAQVICVYNATEGLMQDLLDAKNNIDRAGREASAHSQAALLEDMLSNSPPEKVTIYAHSQGGLITQEALTEARLLMRKEYAEQYISSGMPAEEAEVLAGRRARENMREVDVCSFGSAERGWSPGPRLHQFTNTADPVPKAIDTVQSNRGLPPTDEGVTLIERHRFHKAAWHPITPHSMNDTYLPELNEVHPVPKKGNGKCC